MESIAEAIGPILMGPRMVVWFAVIERAGSITRGGLPAVPLALMVAVVVVMSAVPGPSLRKPPSMPLAMMSAEELSLLAYLLLANSVPTVLMLPWLTRAPRPEALATVEQV